MATRDSSFAYSIDQAQRLFGKGLEVIGSRTGIETLFNYGKEIVAQQDKDIREGNYQPEYTMGLREAYRQGGLNDAAGWVAEKIGENLATSGIALGGGLASALTAPFSVPAAALIGGATILGSGIVGTGEVAEEMEQKTGSYNDSVAIGAGTIIALLDRFGAGRVIPRDELLTITGKELIKKLGQAGKIDAAREIGRRIGKSVAFEGGTEGLQEGVVVGSTALTGGEYTGEQVADRLLEGVVLGGTMGGGFRGALEIAGRTPDAYSGIRTLVGDIFAGGGMMPPGMQVAMQTAANLTSPRFAKLRMDAAPKTDAEILLNETAGKGSGQLTVKDKVAKNLEITTDEDPDIDENQSFFSKDLEGDSVGNPKAQKKATDEVKSIEEYANRLAENELNDPANSQETDRQRIEIDRQNRIKTLLAKSRNRERLTDTEDPVVSPLRIKLIKFAKQKGLKNPIKVRELYEHLRSQDTNVEGSVGFIGKLQASTVEGAEERYRPKDDLTPEQKKEFGKLVKSAPKIKTPLLDKQGNPIKDKKGNPKVRETPDYEAIPRIKELGIPISVPVFVKDEVIKFDNEDAQRPTLKHYKGGEAFTSGLEEYLARNYNETKTMEEIINQFDRMRPTVRLDIRSATDASRPRAQKLFTDQPKAAGDFLTDPNFVLPEGTSSLPQGYSGQRIFNSFTIAGTPVVNEALIGTGQSPITASVNSPRDYEFDKISVIAKNPDHERLMSGDLTKSPVINTIQQQEEGGKTFQEYLDADAAATNRSTKELKYPGGHDYYDKGFGYTRSMIVEGLDGKLYAVLEEDQSDVTRTYENLLDFSKPEYDLALPLSGVPELLSGSIDMALKGNDPYLTKKAALLGTTSFTDRRPVKNLNRTRDNFKDHKLFTPSEKNKIDVLDDMDQNMSEFDAPSQYDVDLRDRKKKFDEAVNKLNIIDDQINKNQIYIDTFTLTERAPQELEKFVEIGLEDLIKFRKEAIPRMKKYFALRRRTPITKMKPLTDSERNSIINNYIQRFGNTTQIRMEAEKEIERIEDEKGKEARKISFRQQMETVIPETQQDRLNLREREQLEQLNGLDEIIERTLFSDVDYEAFFEKLKENIDEDNFAVEDFVSDLEGFIAGSTDPFDLVAQGKLRFSNEPEFRNAPLVAKDSFGREIIRLFNEMAGFRDGPGPSTLKYEDSRTGAPTKARFRDKYERYGDTTQSNYTRGFAIDGRVIPNKFIKASKNQRRAFELGHRITVPNYFQEGRSQFDRNNRTKNVELYEEGKDVFSILMKHLPIASAKSGPTEEQYQQNRRPIRDGERSTGQGATASRGQLEIDQQAIDSSKLQAQRNYQKNSVTYDMGRSKEDQLLTRVSAANGYNPDPQDRLREDISKLVESFAEKQGVDFSYFDADDVFSEGLDATETFGKGFYGKLSQDGNQEIARDAVEKALNLAVSDATHEAINEKALDLIKHKVASEITRKHKDAIEKIDFVSIMESSLDDNYSNPGDLDMVTDNTGFVNGHTAAVKYEEVTQKIKDALPNNVVKDFEKILSKAIDEVTEKIGFVPEDGNYKKFMELIDRENDLDSGRAMLDKYGKKLGLDNPDKLKKKILMGSILNREKIDPSKVRFTRDPGETKAQTIKKSMNPLQKFMKMGDKLAKDFFVIETVLKPVAIENNDHAAGSGYSFGPDPSMGNVFQLLTTQAYRGYVQGDKERADRLAEEANKLVYQRGEAKKQRDANEVAEDQSKEIQRRFKKLEEHIEQNASQYNYGVDELKAALERLRNHVETNSDFYIRAPHNANEAQTARGLLHSLIHAVTDPRFEQLYGRPIEGVVLAHRKDFYVPRAIEDSRVRNPDTFGMGTYGSAIQSVLERFEAAGANVDRDRIFEMKNVKNPSGPTASLNRPVQGVIDLSKGSLGRKIAEGKFTFRAKGGYIDLRRKAS